MFRVSPPAHLRWIKHGARPNPDDSAGLRLGEAVADEARMWNADLVVVGSHGRSGVTPASS